MAQKTEKIGCCAAAGCEGLANWWKEPLANTVRSLLGVALKGEAPQTMPVSGSPDSNRYIVAFCGSGTGHLTQALAVVRMLKAKGMVLGGVITDEDASKRMLEEMIMPLGVEVLILPTIKIVDNEKGMVPVPLVFKRILGIQAQLMPMTDQVGAFLSKARAALILNFWHITFARMIAVKRLPASIRVVHISVQFSHRSLDVNRLQPPIEIVTKSTIDVMASIFGASGDCVAISPLEAPNSIAPILEVPAAVGGSEPRLLLCYFLVQKEAARLEEILHRRPLPGVEVHCFTATALPEPKGRPLALHSHAKQRALFQACRRIRTAQHRTAYAQHRRRQQTHRRLPPLSVLRCCRRSSSTGARA